MRPVTSLGRVPDARSGGSFEVDSGCTALGAGKTARFVGNIGLPPGAAGFANPSLEYGSASRDRPGGVAARRPVKASWR